jgi:hypothetical protein
MTAFEAAATDAAKTLGHFLRGEETDLDAAERAVVIAETACELAGTAIGLETLAGKLAWGADLGPGVAGAALRLLGLEPRWNNLGTAVDRLRMPPLTEAIDGARQADACFLRLVEGLHPVDEVAARPVRLDDAERWLRLRREVERAEREFRGRDRPDTAAFGPAWNGRATEWGRLAAGLAWAASVKTALGGAISPEGAARLATMLQEKPALGLPLENWTASIGNITAQFQRHRASQVQGS